MYNTFGACFKFRPFPRWRSADPSKRADGKIFLAYVSDDFQTKKNIYKEKNVGIKKKIYIFEEKMNDGNNFIYGKFKIIIFIF